jgi:hypothetical protein
MPTDRPGHPHAHSAVAIYIDKRVDELRGVKTQREIAVEAGFARANVISMIKRGETKLPLDRVASLARALDVDPAHLLRLGLIDLWPHLAGAIDEIFGKQLASANEHAILLAPWRAATGDSDPAPNAQIVAAVSAMLAELFGAALR